MKGVLSGTFVSMVLLLVADIGWAARIESVEPVDPLPDQLVVVNGTSFGPAPGPTGPRWISLAPIVGGVSGNAEPACPVPIVDWSENRILILVSGCEPKEYRLAIRDSNSRDFVRARESNEVPLTVRGLSSPPAVGAVRGRGWIARVHPELASPGQLVDLYGDFPNPDPSNDEVILVPSDNVTQQNPDIRKQWVLQPLPGELAKQHIRVRLPADRLAAGEYLMIPAKRRGLSGNGKRVAIRSTEPAKWESKSQFRNVAVAPFRLVGIVKNVGIGAEELDVLGLNLGTMAGPRGLHLMSRQDLDNLEQNIRHKNDPQAPLHGIPPSLPVTKWSDTRIRIRVSEPFPAGEQFVIMSGASEAWSNPVLVRFP
jgi:hypothetical protein